MSAIRKIFFLILVMSAFGAQSNNNGHSPIFPWSSDAIGRALGWIANDCNVCGGYFVDKPFTYPIRLNNKDLLEITSNEGVLSRQRTSILKNEVTINRDNQQITAHEAYVYRDPVTHKINIISLVGDVHIREPNTLIIGNQGDYNVQDKTKKLDHIFYRTALMGRQVAGSSIVPRSFIQRERIIDLLSAWGAADHLAQNEPKVYELCNASFSTCPPDAVAWQVKASHIVLDKNTGRGYATHARLMIRDIPVFYTPYISFSIDRQRKSGFLWPTFGLDSNQWGPYILVPYYWNMAPNYDMVITPGFLTKRGVQISDYFRYLNHYGSGTANLSILPNDREFQHFKEMSLDEFGNSPNPVTQAELNRLLGASNTRTGFWWRDSSRYNVNWASDIDFSYASDDYYLRDYGNDLNEITKNQLLQEADLYYNSEHWASTLRFQAYQTLHPLESTQFLNQYRRLPQFIINANYPDQWLGLEYFMSNELTHFEILNDPGMGSTKPIGNRLHVQPGFRWPFYRPYFYFIPRAQLALTDYNLYQTKDTQTPKSIHRAVPIIDLTTGLSLLRETKIFGRHFSHTLEPQLSYTYVPFRDQSDIPIFDTTVNTLTYDQIFNYNRFSGIDRIGDTNQVAVGLTSRLIDTNSGLEKVRFGAGTIFYFTRRRVTLCNDDSCSDNPNNHSNKQRMSSISGILNYNVDPFWGVNTLAIWDPVTKQLSNSTITFHYQSAAEKIINVSFSYAREGDILSGIQTTDSRNNLKVTDVSFIWPAFHQSVKFIGRWSQNWNHAHLQNLLYGLQYDSCCWAVRLVGGRAFTGLDAQTNRFTYHNQVYLQFALKGLGNVGTGNPNSLLRNISGYNPQFGEEL